uniref:Putative hemolymph juvenile hormone binding protein n=1 Tax=Phlebotomus kandelakii TaxID=1109342 RepID=A0A6B2EAR1_9DIPT
MRILALILVSCVLLWHQIRCESAEDDEELEISTPVTGQNAKVAESRLSAQIFAVIDHYKQPDPIGLPGAPVPDPMKIPPIKKTLTMTTLQMENVLAYGLSKFRIKFVKMDMKEMRVFAGVQVDKMTLVGNYTLNSLFSRSSGPFTVVLKDVFTQGNVTLGVERDGKIRTQDITMDSIFADMSMDFQNLGFMGAVFQSVVNSAPNLVFDAMKPFMLKEAYAKISTEVDSHLEKAIGDNVLPNSISPLDMAIAEGRKKVRAMGYDPFKVRDYNHTVGMFSMEMTNTWIIGVSSFYRVGNMTVTMENNTVTIRTQVGTQQIKGSTQWELSVGNGMVTRGGRAQFTVEHIKMTSAMSQSLDVRNRPVIKDLQMELGNIQVRTEGAGTLDYLIEFAVNILPNLLRYQIMDAIENPAKTRVQEELNKIDVEKFIRQKLPEFEKMGLKMDFDFQF